MVQEIVSNAFEGHRRVVFTFIQFVRKEVL